MTKLTENTPFDQYTRQQTVAFLLNSLRKDDNVKFSILDVGGYKGKTRDFLSQDRVTVVDVFDIKEPDYIRASGLNLPFADNAFDFTLSFDVLEHIRQADRLKFLQECSRTASRGIIICAPHSTTLNHLAERELNLFYKKLRGVQHRWLREHLANGLPTFTTLEDYAKQKGWHVLDIYSNDIYLWMLMQGALFINEQHNYGAQRLIELNSYYNKRLGMDIGLGEEDSYRCTMAIFKRKSDYDSIHMRLKSIEKNNEELKISVTSKLLNYFGSVIQIQDSEWHKEVLQLQKEIKNLSNELSSIKSSKTWRLAHKLSRIKGAVLK